MNKLFCSRYAVAVGNMAGVLIDESNLSILIYKFTGATTGDRMLGPSQQIKVE